MGAVADVVGDLEWSVGQVGREARIGHILPLAETLERERPDLSGHRYCVIALGDMTYQDTYCGGGKKVDKVLELCGARKVGDRLEVDASSQPLPDEEALGWIEGWKNLV